MRLYHVFFLCLCPMLLSCASSPSTSTREDTRREVIAVETAFAQSMAARDHAAFAAFIAEEAVFFSGSGPLRGRQAIVDGWARFFVDNAAPFSWTLEEVEVLASGTLALSSGPVRNAEGKVIARFTSIWRREAPGSWRVIFDKGSEVCDCKAPGH